MRVVVTGGTGNVGTALVRELRMAPWCDSIVSISRRAVPRRMAEQHQVEQWPWDLANDRLVPILSTRLAGVDAIVHLAWLLQPSHDERALHRTNVDGAANLLEAAAAAGVPHVVVVSSVGAYSAGPKDDPVDEGWPTGGVPTSSYSRHKVEVERLMDNMQGRFSALSRVRPGLVFQRAAGAEIIRYFLGPLVPVGLLGRLRLPALPVPSELVFQAVHGSDLARAITTVLQDGAGGAYNVAADPVLTPDHLARAIGADGTVPLSLSALRALVDLTWRCRLQPTEPGWLDLAAAAPVMATDRIRALGWSPERSATESLDELIRAMADRAGAASPPLQP